MAGTQASVEGELPGGDSIWGGGYGVACSATVGERYNLDSAAAMTAKNCCCSGEEPSRNCKEQGAVPSSSLPVPY